MRQFEMVVEPCRISLPVLDAARAFRPDAIFTIPDNTLSWTAYRLAHRLGVPLITDFQDWWPRGQFTLKLEEPFPWIASWLESRFRRMYRFSGVAFCTSAGMRKTLGPHPSAPILYPCPARRNPDFVPDFSPPDGSRPFTLVYAGTVINDYGRSVLRLARAVADLPSIKFEVYGPPPDWSPYDYAWMDARGIYRGLLPFDQLKARLHDADACLVVMSFSQKLELMMRTSFTSKFLEYVQFAKPVVVWGPEYCQPVRVARASEAGLTVERDCVDDVVTALESLRRRERWTELARGAWSAANGIFDHERIHQIFRESINDALTTVGGKSCR
jgi:glycosyltransferase involved in cell wall biosynthesis